MNLARILYPVQVLGPGKRIGLWVCGCGRRCRGCSNPELWDPRPAFEISVDDAFSLIRRIAAEHPVDGFTVSGGEPMDQAREVAALLRRTETLSRDVLLYTGYTLEELQARTDEGTKYILQHLSVLIDGGYVEALNDGSLLRGSSNQRIHILNEGMRARYGQYLASARNQIQNFITEDGIVSVGIHHRGWQTPPGETTE